MNIIEFELKTEYIELTKLLKLTGVAESGGMAKSLVQNEEVLVNGKVDLRKRYKARKSDVIVALNYTIKLI